MSSSSTHPKSGSKVTVLSSGEKQFAGGPSSMHSSGSSSGHAQAESKRKVGTTFERDFATPAPAAGTSSGARPVLKAGKAVASAPPLPPAQLPMTSLESEFAQRPPQDQRWLLTFPLALKQLYFGFAESANHENTLAALIRRYPELLFAGDSSDGASPMLVAIRRGNWGPVAQFAKACTGSQYSQRLLSSPVDSSTYLTLALAQFVQQQQQSEPADSSPGRAAICTLATACPELLTTADSAGRNPLHHLTAMLTSATMQESLTALLQDLGTVARDNYHLAGCLGNALVAKDSAGSSPVDCGIAAVQILAQEFPAPPAAVSMESAADTLKAALSVGNKSPEFLEALKRRMGGSDFRINLLPSVDDPVDQALTWFGPDFKEEIKLALADVGLVDILALVDRL